jgi:drug/metabolite transporter (DMT)-like permease
LYNGPMRIIPIIACLIAAAFNASGSVLERLATGKPEIGALFSRSHTIKTTFHKYFLYGIGLQLLAFVMQAFALSRAPLVLVEPLLTTDLIFLLLIFHFWLENKVGIREWLAVISMIIGFGSLFIVAKPHGGHIRYSGAVWLFTTMLIAIIVLICLFIVRVIKSTQVRAFLAAVAASLSFALNAAFTKLALDLLKHRGFTVMLEHWPPYALLVSGIVSIYLMQKAFGAGPLAVSQPTMEVIEPTVSVIIGITIFGDKVFHSPLALFGEILGVLVVSYGIISLSTSKKIQQAGNKGV